MSHFNIPSGRLDPMIWKRKTPKRILFQPSTRKAIQLSLSPFQTPLAGLNIEHISDWPSMTFAFVGNMVLAYMGSECYPIPPAAGTITTKLTSMLNPEGFEQHNADARHYGTPCYDSDHRDFVFTCLWG